MAKPKSIVCILCRKEVDFIHEENNQYLNHLKTHHNINFYLHLTLMINLMDAKSLEHFSTVTPKTNAKTLICLLCHKEENFSFEESDQYFSHLKTEHKIVFNLHLIRSINLMDNDGLKGIIKKFEETYDVDDSATDQTNLGNSKDVNDFVENDYANLDKNSKNKDEEKMLVEEESVLDNSAQVDHEEMYSELEEELINNSEATNYYKSQNGDALKEHADRMKKSNLSEDLLNESNYSNVGFPNDSMNVMEDSFNVESSGGMSFPVGGEFDNIVNPAGSQDLSYGATSSKNGAPSAPASKGNVKKVKEVNKVKPDQKGKDVEFAMVIQKEIEKGNLSTTQQVQHKDTAKKMKEITAMFMDKTTCKLCDKLMNNKSHLHEHIESIHNSQPVYFCHLCQEPMTNSSKYRHHKKKCTG